MDNYKGMERRRARGTDSIDGLISRTMREGVPLDSLQLRKGENVDGKVLPKIEADVRKRLENLFPFVKEPSAHEALEKLLPSLARYKGQYDRLPDAMKTSMTWEMVEARLLASGGKALKKAEVLLKGGVLFGIEDGKILFADGGTEIPGSRIVDGSRTTYRDFVKVIGSVYENDVSLAEFETTIIDDKNPWHKTAQIVKDSEGKPVKSGYRLMKEGREPIWDEKKNCKVYKYSKEEELFMAATGLTPQDEEIRKEEIRDQVSSGRDGGGDSRFSGTGRYHNMQYKHGYRRVIEV